MSTMWTRAGVRSVVAMAGLSCGAVPNASEVLGGGTNDAAVSAYCAELDLCCPRLPAEVQKSCRQLAAQTTAMECSSELTALARECNAPSGPPDAAVAVDATVREAGAVREASAADAAVACTLLEACCNSPALPPGQVGTCQSVQGAGDEGDCASLFSDLTASASCSGVNVSSGGACPDLQACCTSAAFPAQFLMACTSTAADGDNSACASDLAEFLPAGYCGGVLGFLDGGHPQDPDCTMLAMCCHEITFPMETVSTCDQIVAGNDGGNCLSAYDSYAALGYCE